MASGLWCTAALTRNIEIITAIKPALYHPVVLAKQALQIEEISGGRFGINVVNAWFKPEIARAGLPFLEHDDRYAYGREWITIVHSPISGHRTTFHGKHFHVDDYQLKPASKHRRRPAIYVGGESDPARSLAADFADVWFVNGQPEENVRRLLADVTTRPRAGGPVRFGLAAFVIGRATLPKPTPCSCLRLRVGWPRPTARRQTSRTHSAVRGSRHRTVHAAVPAIRIRDAPIRRGGHPTGPAAGKACRIAVLTRRGCGRRPLRQVVAQRRTGVLGSECTAGAEHGYHLLTVPPPRKNQVGINHPLDDRPDLTYCDVAPHTSYALS